MISESPDGASTKTIILAILKRGRKLRLRDHPAGQDITGGELDWSEPMLYPSSSGSSGTG